LIEPFSHRDTAVGETPARFATSLTVAFLSNA
jgi:hypothetical protein